MRQINRRRALAGALSCSVLALPLTTAESARADFFGGDLPLLAAILGDAITTVAHLATMITQAAYQIQMLETMAKALKHPSFASVMQFIGSARMAFNSLMWGIRSLTYTLNRLDSEFNQLFPSDHPAHAPVAQHQEQYRQWHQEIVASSQIASRQQTTVSSLDEHAAKMQDLVQQSESQSGATVAQLQIIVQSLAVIAGELINLNQTLATTGRVLTDVAAAEASGQLLSAQKKDDHRANYTYKGTPNIVPSKLP